MSNIGQLNIQLSLETVQFQQALSKSDHQVQKFAKNFVVDLDKATSSARQFSDRTTAYLKNIENTANNLNKTIKFEHWANNLDCAISAAGKLTQLS